MIGKVISHYRIKEQIGVGGMGIVYKAEDLLLDRNVAIKFLPSNLTGTVIQKNRFINEAKALATLNHPNVATIFGIESSDENSFIVMEFVEGCNLRKVLIDYRKESEQYNMPIEIILKLIIQITQGLRSAHQKQIVHRDIKPENIMINAEGIVKILDFGLAKMAGMEQLTKTGTTIGTAAYMSPEQATGQPIDQRTDIWSLGVVLYEMIAGKRPFRGDYEQAIIYSLLNETPDPVDLYRQDVPENIKNIVNKTLSKKPADRYENCEELLDDLQSCRTFPEANNKIDYQKPIIENNKPGAALTGRHKNIKWYLKSIKKRIRISWTIILSILILFATGIYIFTPEFHNTKSYGKKIAVLPFVNMSKDINDEYFSDGIMEDILTQLVKIAELKVISRTTMMHYKNSDKNLKEIGGELNADFVLEGSVRHYADKLRISVQLIDAKTDEHVWAEGYDSSIKDVFKVQSQIAYQVAGTLQAELSSGEKEGLDKPVTISPDAYNAYLQGRYFLQQRTREDVEKAIYYFRQAVKIDPDYANAWAGLAHAHSIEADMGILPIDEGYKMAMGEVEKALNLNPMFAEAYARRAWIKMTYNWDWNGAAEDYKLALKLEPGNAAIIQSAGVLAGVLGNLDEAIILSRRALELNPLMSTPNYNLGMHLYYAHRWQEAKTAVRKALELNPLYPSAHLLLGRIYLAELKPKEAFSEIQNEPEINWRKFGLILVYHSLGKIKEEDEALTDFIREYQNNSAYQIAEIYAFRKNIDSTFHWLERAYQQRDGGLGDMKGDPLLDNIQNDPRYAAFMKKMNLQI